MIEISVIQVIQVKQCIEQSNTQFKNYKIYLLKDFCCCNILQHKQNGITLSLFNIPKNSIRIVNKMQEKVSQYCIICYRHKESNASIKTFNNLDECKEAFKLFRQMTTENMLNGVTYSMWKMDKLDTLSKTGLGELFDYP